MPLGLTSPARTGDLDVRPREIARPEHAAAGPDRSGTGHASTAAVLAGGTTHVEPEVRA